MGSEAALIACSLRLAISISVMMLPRRARNVTGLHQEELQGVMNVKKQQNCLRLLRIVTIESSGMFVCLYKAKKHTL